MKFHVDDYFHIGASHLTGGKPCQDYSLSRKIQFYYACGIVSDGCSTGGHTDVGSRLIALSGLITFSNGWHGGESFGGKWNQESFRFNFESDCLKYLPSVIISRQSSYFNNLRQSLDLEPKDMLATCVLSYINKFGAFTFVQGDGVVAIKYRDGSILMTRYDWAKNAPVYPCYNDDDLQHYITQLHDGDASSAIMSISRAKTLDGKTFSSDNFAMSFEEAKCGVLTSFSVEQLQDIEFIAVFSDGVCQVENVDWKDVVVRLLAFKNVTGEFVKRRMIRGIKEFHEVGKGPLDDISCAVIRIEH